MDSDSATIRDGFNILGTEYEFIGFDTGAKKYNCLIKDIKLGIVSKVNHKMLWEQGLPRDLDIVFMI